MKSLIFILVLFIMVIFPIDCGSTLKLKIQRNKEYGNEVYSVIKIKKSFKLTNIEWIRGNLIKIDNIIMDYSEFERIKIGPLYIQEGARNGQ